MEILGKTLAVAIALAPAGIAISSLTSCRSCPVCPEVVNSDSIAASRSDIAVDVRWRIDSVTVRDSLSTVISGDTLIVKEFHFRERMKMCVDTVFRHRIVNRYHTRTVTLTKTVEKPRPLWLKILAFCGAVAILLALFRLRKALR